MWHAGGTALLLNSRRRPIRSYALHSFGTCGTACHDSRSRSASDAGELAGDPVELVSKVGYGLLPQGGAILSAPDYVLPPTDTSGLMA
jgi:hypothetical protein